METFWYIIFWITLFILIIYLLINLSELNKTNKKHKVMNKTNIINLIIMKKPSYYLINNTDIGEYGSLRGGPGDAWDWNNSKLNKLSLENLKTLLKNLEDGKTS